jgi:hypothetical protein
MKGSQGEDAAPERLIEQKLRDLNELERRLQDEATRANRSRALEARAAQRKEVRDGDAKVRAFVKDFWRYAKWKRPRKAAAIATETELLKFGGRREVIRVGESRCQTRIIFGRVDETRFIFMPEGGACRVASEAVPSHEELRRELSKNGRDLWDEAKGKPDLAYQAVQALLSCCENFRALPSNEGQRIEVHFAILTALQALERDVETRSRKLQLAFRLLTEKGWPSQVRELQHHALMLACELGRPPYKSELRKEFDPQERIQTTNFATLLRRAGLGWLPKKTR